MSKVTSTPAFDETKNYEWKPQDEFVLTGDEFGFFFQVVKAEVDGVNVGAKTKLAQFDKLLNILKAAVDKGVATEMIPPMVDVSQDVAKTN